MLFVDKTVSISEIIPRITSHIDGVDTDMVEVFAMDAVIQFVRDTKIMSEIICFTTDNCINSYKLRTNNRITEILSVRFYVNGQKLSKEVPYYVKGDTFYFTQEDPLPPDIRVEVEVATAPPRNSDRVPEFIYEDWLEAIVSLTLYKLYMLTDSEWANPRVAQLQLQFYQQLARQAKITKITRHKAFNMRLSNGGRY